eukprot:NODE_1221_length_1419_cov_58.217492_g1210_i0.p1 GENE.NODE_1221_length_1419_cov_58.217492_g1210_i0~~NODE_1221_length_1419_cov_58.217492_g1210_i0.p1  ORF type:complete len:385 (-),score=110.60 NODE_1221_length_1419_cov_58.217492_g1210_i0:62-1216(-)
MSSTTKPRVVVLGGGTSGLQGVLAFAGKHSDVFSSVTLVEPKDYYESPLGAPIFLVKPEYSEQTTTAFADFLPESVKHVQGYAAKVGKRSVTVELVGDGDEKKRETEDVPFDILVVATGSAQALYKATEPTQKRRRAEIDRVAERIGRAKSVLVVGGGAVGIEIIGEISEVHKGKTLTLVQSADRLVPSMKPKASQLLLERLQKQGVRVLLGDRVDVSAEANALSGEPLVEREIRTKSGATVRADLVISAIGVRANTQALASEFADDVTAAGLKVRPTFQLASADNIFAVGDVAASGDAKLLANIEGQVKVWVANVVEFAKFGEKAKLKHKAAPALEHPFGVPTGESFQVSQLPMCGGIVKTWDMLLQMKLSFPVKLQPPHFKA